jgi:hypothetical protein
MLYDTYGIQILQSGTEKLNLKAKVTRAGKYFPFNSQLSQKIYQTDRKQMEFLLKSGVVNQNRWSLDQNVARARYDVGVWLHF